MGAALSIPPPPCTINVYPSAPNSEVLSFTPGGEGGYAWQARGVRWGGDGVGAMSGEAGDVGDGLPAVAELFRRACESFGRALVRSDEAVLDATDFAGSLHELGFNAGRVRA